MEAHFGVRVVQEELVSGAASGHGKSNREIKGGGCWLLGVVTLRDYQVEGFVKADSELHVEAGKFKNTPRHH